MRRDRSAGSVLAGLTFLVALALLAVTTPAASAKDRENPPPRANPPSTRAPSPPPVSTAPRPSTPRPPSTGAPSGSGSNRGSHSDYGREYGYGRHHRYGWGFGYGHYGHRFYYGYGDYWPYGRFYHGYPQPYYPWGMVWYPAYSSDTRVGAIDLAIKPKKAAVYVDGEYVGTAGKFDGFPGYLWLSEGSHQLVFHLEGRETVERRVRVRPGPTLELSAVLAEGTATDPEELFDPVPERPAETRVAEKREDSERQAQLDLRGEPGRFRLDVAPLDASIYLDGRFLGSGEELSRLHAGMMVDAGEHVLDIQRPGYAPERIEFSVEPGDETEIKVALNSMQAPGR